MPILAASVAPARAGSLGTISARWVAPWRRLAASEAKASMWFRRDLVMLHAVVLGLGER